MTRAYASVVIKARVSEVWDQLRDFASVDRYLETVEVVEVDRPGDQVGCVRVARHRDTGQVFREQLLALSDVNHSVSYTQLDYPAIENCLITVRLLPVSVDNTTFLEWYSDFDVLQGDPEELVNYLVTEVYDRCFAGLQHIVSSLRSL